ncbi:MAG: acyltransferase [Rubrivivax sp.]
MHLDLLRGISAIAVLAQHLRGICFGAPRPDVRTVAKGVYFLTGLGHAAVIFFFVLSGFFIGTSVLDSVAARRWLWRHFLLRRLTRLWVVLIPVLVITFALDSMGMHLFGDEGTIYSGKLVELWSAAGARETLSIRVFFGNLFFLQEMRTSVYGTNGALWSLGYEFWCYLLFPLFVLAFARSSSWKTRGLATLGVLAIFGITNNLPLIKYFGLWLFGAIVAAVWRVAAKRWASTGPWLGFASVLLAGAVAFDRVARGEVWADFALAAATAIFMIVLLARAAQGRCAPVGERYQRFATTLAGFTYTLYLVHFPIVVFFSAACIRAERWDPTATHVAAATTLGFGILAFSYLLARLTERHTDAVRASIEAALGRWMKGSPERRAPSDGR